jgi:ParB/RepB/Spo0J family partition protein
MHLAVIGIHELRTPEVMARAYIDPAGIETLAASIRAIGLIQPLWVKEVDGGYEVVDGHRRLLACRLVGLPALRCLVRGAKDTNSEAIKINANLWRQDTNPVEEAGFFSALLPDFGNDTDKLAKALGLARNYVENRLLLMQGDPDVLNAVAQHQLGLGVAAVLNKISDKGQRDYYLGWAIRTGCTIETARQWLQIADAAAAQPVATEILQPMNQVAAVPSRDIFQCFLCGENEPKVGLEFWHIHAGCIFRLNRAAGILGIDLDGPLLPQLEMLVAQMRSQERAQPPTEVKA